MRIFLLASVVGVLGVVAKAGAATVRPRHDLACVLEVVASHMGLKIKPEVSLPALLFDSETPLSRFQDAIEPQWKMRPDVFTNAYAAHLNEIYLLDDDRWYRNGRVIDDSLAHELTHYLQLKYRGWKVEELDESAEAEAVGEQTWFRDTYEGGAGGARLPDLKGCVF
jgi:hypothetical protein